MRQPTFSALVVTLLVLTATAMVADAQECQFVESKRLLVPDADADAFKFGRGIAADNAEVLVSAYALSPYHDVVYDYLWNGTTWEVGQTIELRTGAAGFGHAIALEGDLAVITAPGDDTTASGAGAAYIYRRVNGSWMQEQKLLASDGAVQDQFGSSAAILGDRVVIGASREEAGLPNSSGAAYIFRFNGTLWVEEQKIKAAVPIGSAYFGTTVDADDGTILVGGGEFSSYAYIFTHDGTQWVQEQRLEAPDPALGDAFGMSVAIDGDRLVVGAPRHDLNGFNNVGAAYAFHRLGGSWTFQQKLTPQLPVTASDASDEFGHAVAINEAVIVIGSVMDDIVLPGNPPVVSSNMGSLRRFHLQGDTWISDGLYRGGVSSAGGPVAINSNDVFGLPAGDGFAPFAPWELPEMLLVFDALPPDCDQNGVPDICDTDCNLNMIADACDITFGSSRDCDVNGVPDECEAVPAYVLDNGVSAGGSILCCGSYNAVRLNHFTVTAGHESLTHIAVAWDSIQLGAEVELVVYDDPNNDGNPSDATLLSRTPVVAPNAIAQHPDQPARLTIHPISRTSVGEAGESFYIGIYTTSAYPTFSAVRDTSMPAYSAWNVFAPPDSGDPLNLSQGWSEPSQAIFGAHIIRGLALDCNANGVWDDCDISSGFSLDANNNGVPDECDGPASPCPADLAPPKAPDGTVNVQDLLAVIGAWGACGDPNDCPADIAPTPLGNDVVNVQDLLAVIAAWGACP